MQHYTVQCWFRAVCKKYFYIWNIHLYLSTDISLSFKILNQMTKTSATACAQLMKLKGSLCSCLNSAEQPVWWLGWDFLYWQHNGFSVIENQYFSCTVAKRKKKVRDSTGLKEIYAALMVARRVSKEILKRTRRYQETELKNTKKVPGRKQSWSSIMPSGDVKTTGWTTNVQYETLSLRTPHLSCTEFPTRRTAILLCRWCSTLEPILYLNRSP